MLIHLSVDEVVNGDNMSKSHIEYFTHIIHTIIWVLSVATPKCKYYCTIDIILFMQPSLASFKTQVLPLRKLCLN